MSMHCLALIACVALLAAVATAGQSEKIPGIGPTGKIVKLQTGFKYTEGGAVDRAGNIYFCDIPNERIYKVDPKGNMSVFREKSNHANGLMINAQGELIVCEMDGRVVALSADGKERRVLADGYDGKRFNAPNDLVIDPIGGVYVSDPEFLAPTPLPQGKTCVYYISPKGQVTRLVDNLINPNGVVLSLDGKTLYVIPTGQANVMAYPIEAPGKLGAGRVFCTLKQPTGKKDAGGDGAKIDSKGNLYVASPLGVQIFDGSGRLLGILEFPEEPANLVLGGEDLRTLYVAARTSLYSVPVQTAGPVFPMKK